MPPGLSKLAPVRKEVRGIVVCAAAHIVYGVIGNTAILELKSNQRGQIAMGFGAPPSDDGATARGKLDLASNILADLERLDANVGTDRNDKLGWIVRKRFDGARHDSGHRATPTGVHCANMPARRMCDQYRHAIGRPCSDPKAFDASDQRIAFQLSNRLGGVGFGDLADVSPMHLPLLEEPTARKIEAPCEASTVLEHRVVVIAQAEPKIERGVRRNADPT